ncbi:MAG: MarR family transcriptional regulator [Erysipelotrichaceae bacterium]|nr:MarR family transcriptional regulator [Erysipelotrichaceae bacterium]
MENQDLIRNVKHLSIQIEKRLNEMSTQWDLTYAQCTLLGYIDRHRDQDITLSDLVKHFDLSHPTVVGIVKRLEEKGFVETKVSPIDKRCKFITPTEKADEFRDNISQTFVHINEVVQQGLSKDELESWTHVMQKMINNLHEEKEKKE